MLVCLPSFAGAPVSVTDSMSERIGPYLVIIKNKMKSSSERFERRKDIRRVSHPAEERFGRSERSSLPIRFVFIQGRTPFDALVWVEHFRYAIRNSGGTNAA